MLERLAHNFGVDTPDQLTEAQKKVFAKVTMKFDRIILTFPYRRGIAVKSVTKS